MRFRKRVKYSRDDVARAFRRVLVRPVDVFAQHVLNNPPTDSSYRLYSLSRNAEYTGPGNSQTSLEARLSQVQSRSPRTSFQFRAQPEILEELRRRAEREDRTLAAEIRHALRAYVAADSEHGGRS